MTEVSLLGGITVVGDRFVLEPGEPRRGGTATVYKARDHESGELVAVKIFEGVCADSDLLQEFFLRETEALAELRHPNIVELRASGQDKNTGKHYVALPWVDFCLRDYLMKNPVDGWDSFAEGFVLPLLDALSLAHSKHILHRDIKPANILVTADGVPKLADFGIAKLANSLRMGLTVNDFATRPFAPPERGTKTASEAGDLFSLGVTILQCFLPDGYEIVYEGLTEAVSEADVPPEAADFLSSLVALDPESRPPTAEIAAVMLRTLQQARPQEDLDIPTFSLIIPPRVADEMTRLFNCRRTELESAVLSDLAEEPAINEHIPQTPEAEVAYQILGRDFSYLARVDRENEDAVALLKALRLPPSVLEHRREHALPLTCRFTFRRPYSSVKAREVIAALQDQVAEHVQRQRMREREAEERRLFRRWEDILKAKTDLERSREAPIGYSWYKVDGHTVVFTLDCEPPESLIGQARCVSSAGGDSPVCGIVDDVIENQLVLYIESGVTDRIPQKGTLIIDNTQSKTAIRRQQKALDDTQYKRGLRPDLGLLLVHPELARHPEPAQGIKLLQPELDDSKKRALEAALGSQDILLVSGPPGTGKTKWIAELVCQFLNHNPGKKVLLTAQTHIAVDTALARISKLQPNRRIVRVGRDEKVSTDVEEFKVAEQVNRWSQEVRRRSDAFLRDWAAAHGVADARMSLATDLEALSRAEQRATELRNRVEDIKNTVKEAEGKVKETETKAEQVLLRAVEIEALIRQAGGSTAVLHQAADMFVEVGLELADVMTSPADGDELEERRRELAEANQKWESQRDEAQALRQSIAEAVGDERVARLGLRSIREAVEAVLSVAAQEATQLGLLRTLQREWLERFGHGREFEPALLSVADVVAGTCVGIASCGPAAASDFDLVVVDEASKATPTEALIALTRGRRWVLVGDQRQLPPFADEALWKRGLMQRYDLSREDLQETLFDRLIKGLPSECQSSLTLQHRMLKQIGDLISECFYDGKLQSSRTEATWPFFQRILPHNVTWFSTSALSRRRETPSRRPGIDGQSYMNLEEATQVHGWLGKLELLCRQECPGEEINVAVITGYAAQRDHLTRELSPEDRLRWQTLKIKINSVDAFQGQEADVLVYSVTRSNTSGDLGFLTCAPRLNVALSRGREALVIFGDATHCGTCEQSENPFRTVLRYMEEHPATCAVEVLS